MTEAYRPTSLRLDLYEKLFALYTNIRTEERINVEITNLYNSMEAEYILATPPSKKLIADLYARNLTVKSNAILELTKQRTQLIKEIDQLLMNSH